MSALDCAPCQTVLCVVARLLPAVNWVLLCILLGVAWRLLRHAHGHKQRHAESKG